LIGLRVFDEAEPLMIYKYYVWYKKEYVKREARRKRYEGNVTKIKQELQSLIPADIWEVLKYKDEMPFMSNLVQCISDWNEQDMPFIDLGTSSIQELGRKYSKITEAFNKKVEAYNDEGFNPDEVVLDDKLVDIFKSVELSEKQFYGFLWTHPLERSPDYEGNMTFESLRLRDSPDGVVEMRIEQVDKMTSKKGNIYWLLKVEDANSEIAFVQVWSDDWERFAEDLVTGQLCRMRVKIPDGGFKRYTLYSPPRHKRNLLPKSKEYDFRVVVLRKGEEDV
jgi:hypothetical protein